MAAWLAGCRRKAMKTKNMVRKPNRIEQRVYAHAYEAGLAAGESETVARAKALHATAMVSAAAALPRAGPNGAAAVVAVKVTPASA